MNSYRNGMSTTIAVTSLYTKLKQRRTLENRSRENRAHERIFARKRERMSKI